MLGNLHEFVGLINYKGVPSYMEIKNNVAVVTRGASGLGEATVRELVGQSAKVAIFDMNAEKGKP
jgi:hypothetical protein